MTEGDTPAPGDSIEAALLPGEVTAAGPGGLVPDLSGIATLKDFKEKTERLFLVEKLKLWHLMQLFGIFL